MQKRTCVLIGSDGDETTRDLEREARAAGYRLVRAADAEAAARKLTGGLAGRTLAEIERRAIFDTLEACRGNKAAAARSLGVCEKTIYNKLKRFRQSRRTPEFA